MNAVLGLVRGLGGILLAGSERERRRTSRVAVSMPGVRVGEVRGRPSAARVGRAFRQLGPFPRGTGRLWRREHLHCDRCRANLRIMALTKALLLALGWPVERDVRAFNLVTFLATHPWTRLLEINDSYVVGAPCAGCPAMLPPTTPRSTSRRCRTWTARSRW